MISSSALGYDLQYRFRQILEVKGYDLSYVEVPFGHNWNNWAPLLDDVLVYYFGADSE